jgi:hypothetical protein
LHVEGYFLRIYGGSKWFLALVVVF